MGWFTDDPPQPPNPIVTAAAQTGTNVATGVANAFLNNFNQVTPQGNLTYTTDPSQNFTWTDPVTNASYTLPKFTATQTPSWYDDPNVVGPGAWQDELNQSATRFNVSETGKKMSYDLMNFLNQSGMVNPANAPAAGSASWLDQVPQAATTFGDVGPQQRSIGDYGSQRFSLGNYGAPQSTFGEAGDITRTYGPADSFSADRSRVEEALYGRLNPQLERDRANLEQRLADQGIRYGSEAYQDAMDDYNRQSTDARLAVTAAGGAEQQRMMDMAAKQAGFQNDAQKQAYEQALGRGAFANTAQKQLFEQMLESGKFENAAQAQQFAEMLQAGQFTNQAQAADFQQAALRGEFANQGIAQQMSQRAAQIAAHNTERAQWLQEQYAARQAPINEVTALQSGSQVAPPNFVTNNNTGMATTDVAGLINNRFSQDLSNYQQQSTNFNSLIGGIFGALGNVGKGYMMSDERVKKDIEPIGTVFASGPNGEKPLPIYEYSFKTDPTNARHVGPMAQDVEKIDKRAVKTIGGVKHISKTRMGSILKAA